MTNLTVEQIAEAIAISKRSAERRAAREGWPYTEQTCRGGRRRLYALDALPADVRAAVERYVAEQAVAAMGGGHGDGHVVDGVGAGARRAPVGGGGVGPAGQLPGGTGLSVAASGVAGVDGALRADGRGVGVIDGIAAPAGGAFEYPASSDAGATPALPAASAHAGAAGSFLQVDVPDRVLVGMLVGSRAPREEDFERVIEARRVMNLLLPLMEKPERSRGRRALAEDIGRALGVSFQHVYRLEKIAREEKVLGLARLGMRRDAGCARVVVSHAWQAWAEETLAVWPAGGGVAELAGRMLTLVRAAWVGGAPSAFQAWLKATAALANELNQAGCPREQVAKLLSLRCPRRFVEAEAQHFRVAGRALRDAKGVYDKNITPVRRTAAGLMPGDVVCGDISPLDIPVLRPDGSTAYARLISWHDLATNWLWVDVYLCDKGEGVRREQVAASFIKMCERAPFGAPRHLYLDNGSEYKWTELLVAWGRLAALSGERFRADEAALLPEAGRYVRSIPFHPRGKRIEGQFGNLLKWLSWWYGFVGGNRMAKKIANLGKAPAVSDFEAVRQWLSQTLADYHVTPQQAEHMRGMSPQQKLDAAIAAGWKPLKVEREMLMLAFADRERRRVSRGAINYLGRTYTADFLMHVEGEVTVAHPRLSDPEYDHLIVIDKRGVILGAAFPERVFGVLDQEGAKEASRRRKAFRLLTNERVAQAGGPLDETQTAGLRAELLGLEATLERADQAADWVQGEGELAEMARTYAEAKREMSERYQRLQARMVALKNAEALTRLAFEDEETKAARALGF